MVKNRMQAVAMISNSSLPPYNRFDRIPQHALQIGLSPHETDNALHFQMQSKTMNAEDSMGYVGSRSSMASTTSSASHESYLTGSLSSASTKNKPASQSSLDSLLSPSDSLLAHLQQELYIEKTAPPPYNTANKTSAHPPNRTELPKKSEAAQQRIAELLKEATSLKPFGKCI